MMSDIKKMSSRRKMKTSDILINEIHAASTETLKTAKNVEEGVPNFIDTPSFVCMISRAYYK
jgi:hypothetical protein